MKILKTNALKIVIVMGLITITSCKKENLSIETVLNKDEQLYNLIMSSGVKSENIKDVGEYYLVEGDMLFKKTSLI